MNTLTQIIDCKPAARMVLQCFGRDLNIRECNATNLKRLVAYMQTQVCKNSARTYAAYIKAALNLDGTAPKGFQNGLKVRKEDTISVYLTEDELSRLQGLHTAGNDRYYLLHFLISANEGCRMSDVQNITAGNITDGMLRYICKKTGCKAEVPARDELSLWLDEIKSYGRKEFVERTYNRLIPELCEMAEINDIVKVYRGGVQREAEKYKFVSSHTARRSFATNLYRRGCDLYTISRYMGHSSMDMTMRYICSETREMNDSIRAFFHK